MSQSSFSASASIKWRSPVKIGTIMFASVASLAASIGSGAPARAMATRGLFAFCAISMMCAGAFAVASERKGWVT